VKNLGEVNVFLHLDYENYSENVPSLNILFGKLVLRFE
jgi:hypothetical protein